MASSTRYSEDLISVYYQPLTKNNLSNNHHVRGWYRDADYEEQNSDADENDLFDDLRMSLSEQDFIMETKRAKVSFMVFKQTVAHLVANSSYTNESMVDVHRLSALENVARNLLEKKAQACHAAVEVAKKWAEQRRKREEMFWQRRDMRGSEAAIFYLTKSSLKHEVRKLELKKIEKQERVQLLKKVLNGHNTLVAERNVNSAGRSKESKNETSEKRLDATELVENKIKRGSQSRHPSCITKSLPTFYFRDSSLSVSIYGTTNRIGSMVRWKLCRKYYIINSLKSCGCEECLRRLRNKVCDQTM